MSGSVSTGSNIGGAAGAKHVADMLGVNGALMRLDISNNMMGADGVKPICEALKQNTTLKVLDLNAKNVSVGKIGPQGARYLADMLGVNTSLTKVLVGRNRLFDEGTTILCDALRESTVSKVEELDLSRNGITPVGAKAVAALCAVRGALTSVSCRT